MHAHRVDILDRADDDAIIRLVADDFHLKLFPADNALLDKDFIDRRGIEPALADQAEFLDIIGNATARATEREGGADNGRQTDLDHRRLGLLHGMHDGRARALQADFFHGGAEALAVLGLIDDIGLGADHLDLEQIQHAAPVELKGTIERCLAAHGWQQGIRALDLDHLGDHFRRDGFNIGRVRELRIGHDRRRVGIDQDHPVALGLQRLHRLHPGIIEFAGLADDDRTCANDQDGFDVGAFGHGFPVSRARASGLPLRVAAPGGRNDLVLKRVPNRESPPWRDFI